MSHVGSRSPVIPRPFGWGTVQRVGYRRPSSGFLCPMRQYPFVLTRGMSPYEMLRTRAREIRLGNREGHGLMAKFVESEVENAALAWLAGLGYAVLHGPDIGSEGTAPERGSYDEVLLTGRLCEAFARLNPHLPAETLEEALRKVRQTETPSLVEENRRLHRYLVEGIPVEVAREDGSIGGDTARLVDFDDVKANDWLAVNQFTVIEHEHNRRPDVVLFVNGLPLAVIETEEPGRWERHPRRRVQPTPNLQGRDTLPVPH